MYLFVNGMITMGCLVAAGFFFHLRQQTSERLFAFFGAAFALFALERFVLSWLDTPDQDSAVAYLIRLLGFVFIIVAIVDKNRPTKNS